VGGSVTPDVDKLTKQLTDARLAWDRWPRGASTASGYADACAAFEPLGVSGLVMHRAINARLGWTPDYAAFPGTPSKPATPHIPAAQGASVPDAVQSAVNDLVPPVRLVASNNQPEPPERCDVKEAS